MKPSPSSRHEILTLKDVTHLLKVAEKTVYTMAQNREIPAFKVRGQWRFRRKDIDRWIDNQTDNKPTSGKRDE
jgi:excisionase family DNA binding protein